MPKPNNPYARPVHATKESAMIASEFYGTRRGARATDKTINHAAGGRNVAPASRYQAVGNAYVAPTTSSAAKSDKTKSHSVRNEKAPVTAEDLFGP